MFTFLVDQLKNPEVYVFKSADGITKIVIVFTTEAGTNYDTVFGTTDIQVFEPKVSNCLNFIQYVFK